MKINPAVASSPAQPRMLNAATVCELVSLCRSTVYMMVKDGAFPKPVKIGKRRVA
jgi:predicted DNA-binding transcriptional regulator AlpA